MSWTPMTEAEIWEEINNSWNRMSPPQQRLWEVIKIDPEKWSLDPWGTDGGGFWVVAIFGKRVIWYNDIEEGFNSSAYESSGRIAEYWCNQDDLEWTIQSVIEEISTGRQSGGRAGPPEPLSDKA